MLDWTSSFRPELFASSLISLFSEHQDLYPWQLPPTIIPLSSVLQASPTGIPLRYKYLGALYQGIDWQNILSEYAPPYKILLSTGETVEITSQAFEQWANAKTSD